MSRTVHASWRGLVISLLFGLAALMAGAAQASRVDIAAVEHSRDLFDALTVRVDASATLTLEQVAADPGRPPASRRALHFGYTTAAIWLQLRVGNDSPATQTRWLSVGHTRLEHVALYRLDATASRIEASWVGGTAQPLAARPIAGKESLFPVTLEPGEEAVLVLRIQGRTLIALDANLWEPTRYREHEAQEDLRLLVPAGALLAVSLYLLASALYRRDRPFVLLALWLCSAVACELALKGYLFRFLLDQGGEVVVRAPILFLSLSLSLSAAFIGTFLGAGQSPALTKVIRGVCLTGVLLMVGATFASIRVLALVFIAGVSVLCLSYPFILASAWRRRHPNVGLFVFALTGLWANVIARMLVMLGILPPSELSSTALSFIYAVGLGGAAILGVVRRTITQHQNALDRERGLMEAQRKEQALLEAAIVARTRALQDATIAADEANRAKSDFLARVSHDLRAPLTAILGYADLIIGSGGSQGESGRVIRRSAQHLLGLLNDLIDYARGGTRPEALQPLPVYAASLLDSIAAEGASLARRNDNRFDYQLSCELPPVIEVDEKRLRQVLVNLLDNAAKFTQHGHIRFKVQCRGDPGPDELPRIVFTVEDDGPGMAPAEVEHIFEPFQRLKATENHEGLGLGLAIAHQWVECMNGRIDVDSALGAGTRIRVELPIRPASEDTLSHANQTCGEDNLPELDGAGRRVWVVEDSHEIRNLLCLELRSQGFGAVPIANGHDALTLLASPSTAAPDLVLTDLKMPFASGEDVLAGVREKWPGVPVVLLTATPDAVATQAGSARSHQHSTDAASKKAAPFDAVTPSRHRFSAILSKPVSLLLLRRTLAELLGLEAISPIPPAAGASEAALIWPDASRLAEALTLIRMGAVSDLIDWADALLTENAAWAPFATRARKLAEHGEMSGLLRLCQPPTCSSTERQDRGPASPRTLR